MEERREGKKKRDNVREERKQRRKIGKNFSLVDQKLYLHNYDENIDDHDSDDKVIYDDIVKIMITINL